MGGHVKILLLWLESWLRPPCEPSEASRERGGFADGHGQTASVKFGLHASFATLSCFNRVDLLLIRMCQVRGIQG